MNQLYILMLKKEEAFVIVEEPEAHLYPSLQHKLVEFIAYFANINHSSVLITTHSPYILTSVSLCKSNKIGQIQQRETNHMFTGSTDIDSL
ncbi:AAA family ATPase [Lachnospiraceae bacterium KK002]